MVRFHRIGDPVIENENVTLSRDGKVEEIIVPYDRTGVPLEIHSLATGKSRPEQGPEAALADRNWRTKIPLKNGELLD
ncbi:hypothetical protein GCG54_00004376 [Colletotrichum gloeosporioides]|uniref:Uncharacterized protein n=1 Tax=Colletotrichum gloeosporioides TaxID=474922 RepID=A0A8H4CLH3_COLGL|nr:uncharacterized protein GCG54_00004376 [Colletotrichum gloeosporioides]KAF3806051.1 hypothetical protein GCG54_00004376 [Colletotrichum gloeosporioides]